MRQISEAQRQDIGRLTHICRTLLSGLNENQQLLQRIKGLKQQLEDIGNNRGLKQLTIGFLGPKNHGKSYLLRSLLNKASLRDQIKVGVGRSGRTDKLVWVGQQRPSHFDSNGETFIEAAMPDSFTLQHDVTLVDVPGFTELNSAAQKISQRAITNCQLKLLIVKAGRVEDAILGSEAWKLDGSPILPILNAVEYPLDSEETRSLMTILEQEIATHAPNSHLLPPLALPRMDYADAKWSESDLQQRLSEHLHRVIMELDQPSHSADRQIQVQIDRFKGDLCEILSDFLARANEIEQEYHQREEAMEVTLFNALFGNERLETTAIRLALREQRVHKIPVLLFPYRSVSGLLALTSGAWDRLAIGMAGSLPSLALTTLGARDNLKQVKSMQRDRSALMLERLTEEAARGLGDSWQDYCQLLHHAGAASKAGDDADQPKVKLHGIEGLQLAYREILERTSGKWAGSGWFSAMLAFTLFWGMLSGPLYSLYQQYLLAWIEGFSDKNMSDLLSYPDPGFGTLFAALMLATIPMFVIGAISMSSATSSRKIGRCRKEIEQQFQQEYQRRLSERTLHFGLEDDRIMDLRWLLNYLMKK